MLPELAESEGALERQSNLPKQEIEHPNSSPSGWVKSKTGGLGKQEESFLYGRKERQSTELLNGLHRQANRCHCDGLIKYSDELLWIFITCSLLISLYICYTNKKEFWKRSQRCWDTSEVFLYSLLPPKIFLSITSCKHTSLLWTAMKVETLQGGSLHTVGQGKEVGGHPSMTAPRVQAAQSWAAWPQETSVLLLRHLTAQTASSLAVTWFLNAVVYVTNFKWFQITGLLRLDLWSVYESALD